jgi:myosin heavy subunit
VASEAPSVQEANRLKQEKEAMAASLAQREQELAARQKEISELRGQLGSALRTAESYRREGEQQGVRLEHSTSQTAQLADELQNREKQLAASTEEIAHINQLRATDKASLEAEQARIKEISDQLRIADATLDMERQLSSEGRDIRALLVARQLHVVDVRDTDANGKPSQAFARVFLTEGKSLMFFAFDLNEANTLSAKARFQVWGEQLGKKGSVRSLGVLSVDDKAQNRWALKVENPGALSEINSVFVTISPQGSSNSGQRLLYAYLGEPNHS